MELNDVKGCKVIILAGGLGTRLKEETEFKPKPMVKIGNKPIIFHIMNIYSKYGFNDFIIAAGYKSEMIKEYFLNFATMNNDIHVDLENHKINLLSNEKFPFKVTIVDTGQNTMTGGRIKRLQKYIGNNRFMVTYGDGVADINIKELMDFHISQNKIATVTGVRPTSRFGKLKIEGHTVTDFKEKPQGDEGFINGGFFVFEPEIFNYIKDDSIMLEGEPLETISKLNQLSVFRHDKFWKCMDTYKDVETLNELWDKGRAEWIQ
ncbi:MAG: glucose-1-phosphate cytidylyltransferase [Nanoarchaeota archaeon]|nr:glucose-1-phosphate cytidylyltransferase [Nanoarchaeota archaeon]